MKPIFRNVAIREFALDLSKFDLGDVLVTQERGITGFIKKYKITKKTTTVLQVVPYHWWDRIIDYFRKEPSELEA